MNICGENVSVKVSAVIAHKIKSIYFQIHHAAPGSVVNFTAVFREAKELCSSAAGRGLGNSNLETYSPESPNKMHNTERVALKPPPPNVTSAALEKVLLNIIETS